jgi:hypothetical protein
VSQGNFSDETEPLNEIEQLESKVLKTFVQAACAWVFKDYVKSRATLFEYFEYRSRLAQLTGIKAPQRCVDPQNFFKNWDWYGSPLTGDWPDSGFDTARVPRKRPPDKGAGEVALPLPKSKREP